MRFLANNYQRTVNLKLLILFSILLPLSWIISSLIINSPPSMIILASIAVVIFGVIFFNPRVGLMSLLFVIPFEYIVPSPISIYKIISLVFLISWLARKVITKERIRFSFKYPQTKYLTGLIFALALSLFFSIDKGASLPFFKRFVLLSLMCVFLIDLISSPGHLRKLAWVIGLSGGLASLVGLMQYQAFNTGVLGASQPLGLIEEYQEGVRVAGFTGNPNRFAIDLVVSICFLLYCFSITRNLVLRILIVILIVCSAASIFLTLSRSGVLALVIGMVLYSVSLKGLKFTALLSLPIIGLALIFSLKFAPDFVYDRLINVTFHEKDTSREDRVKAATSSIRIFLEQPNALLTGIGLNNYPTLSWKNKGAHNMFIQMLVETGLIGFTFFFILIYRSYKGLWNFVKLKHFELQPFCVAALSAFTAILVKGLLGDLAYDKYLWLFFVLVPILYNVKKRGYATA